MENYLGGRQTGWSTALALAVVYVALGRLGLLLAIPPGYATALWPASGVALAFVLRFGKAVLPGVWLGAFFVHVWTALDLSDAGAFLASLQMPMLLGLAAALQAQLGAVLIRRCGDLASIPVNEGRLPLMLFLGGPVACLVNCTLGIGGLWMLSRLPAGAGWFSWWTWWAGDCIGVLVFAPVTYGWLARPNHLTGARRLIATLPLLLMFALAVGLYLLTSRHEQTRQGEMLDQDSALAAQRLDADFEHYLTALSALEGLFLSQPDLDGPQFQKFAERLQSRLPGLYAVAWDEKVLAHERAAYEARMRNAGDAGLTIKHRDAQGRLVESGPSDYYVPVTYARYQGSSVKVTGFDMASEPLRRAALERAAETGLPTASAGVRLVSDPEPGYNVLVLLAVRAAQDPTRIRGFAGLSVRISAIMAAATRGLEPTLVARLYDRSALRGQQLLYGPESVNAETGGLRSVQRLTVAGRRWDLEFVATPGYLFAHRSWQAWATLAGGLLLTSLLGLLALLLLGRTTRIERLVALRTRELADKNTELHLREQEMSRMLDELTGSEALLRSTAGDLTASNMELEQFAYITSHDLQAPLRGIAGFAQLLKQRCEGKLDGEANEFLGYIEQGCRQMQEMVRDLLNLSRVGRGHAKFESASLADTVARAQLALAADVSARKAQVQCEPLPEVCADHGLLVQLFQNLLGNAIKFQQPDARPEVHISAGHEGEDWLIRITDNGIGIPEEELDNIFAIFRRLHTQDEYEGTGIGLAICRKIAKHHHGDIRAVKHAGGACFELRLPVQPPAHL